MKRRVEGVAIDATYQSLDEAPHWQNSGETVWVTPRPTGEVRTEGEPPTDDEREREGQTTLADFGGDLV